MKKRSMKKRHEAKAAKKPKRKTNLIIFSIVAIIFVAELVYVALNTEVGQEILKYFTKGIQEVEKTEIVYENSTLPNNTPDPEQPDRPLVVIERTAPPGGSSGLAATDEGGGGGSYTPYYDCEDTDGKNFYIKGQAKGYWIVDSEPFDYPPTTKEDWCIGNMLTEMICQQTTRGDIPRMVGTTHTCELGCNDGACNCASNDNCGTGYECTDSRCIKP